MWLVMVAQDTLLCGVSPSVAVVRTYRSPTGRYPASTSHVSAARCVPNVIS